MLDVGGLGVAGHSSDAIVERGKEINGDEPAKELVEVESGGGGNEENVLGAVSFGGGELGEDGFHRIRDGEREKVFGESVFPGDS